MLCCKMTKDKTPCTVSAPLVPNVLAPMVPLFTLADGTAVVPGEGHAVLDSVGPAPYGTPRPPSGIPAGAAQVTPAAVLRVPQPQPQPCAAVPKIRRPPNAFMVFANEHR